MAYDRSVPLICDESAGTVGAAYRDDVTADKIRLASRDERRLACDGDSIALR